MKAIAPALLALSFILVVGDRAAAGSSVTICKVAGSHCSMRCRQKPYPALARRCRDACNTTQARCIQQAYKDIELGKVRPPTGGGTTKAGPRQSEEEKKNSELGKTGSGGAGASPPSSRQSEEEKKNIELGKVPPPTGGATTTPKPRQSEEDKKNAEMGRTTPPAGRPSPGSTPPQPCAAWQVRYANGSCGCPSGMRGPKCEEIILH
jgi:hypothetical protein